jgi:hypothetical protein
LKSKYRWENSNGVKCNERGENKKKPRTTTTTEFVPNVLEQKINSLHLAIECAIQRVGKTITKFFGIVYIASF